MQPQQQQILIQQQQQPQQTVQQVLVQSPPQQQQQQQSPQSNQPQTQQIIVNNASLAQQLAQGKLQVANVNGQQVIVKPLGNNQVQIVAHIKTQTDGQSHIVANPVVEQTVEPQSPVMQQTVQQRVIQPQAPKAIPQQQHQQQTILSTPPQQQQPQQTAQNPATQISPSIEQSLLQGQPPGTVIKCVTAQVIQTQNGPRIVLQGLQGNDFTPQQLALVQQQVKQQLLKGMPRFALSLSFQFYSQSGIRLRCASNIKYFLFIQAAQESSGKTGVLGPTKIYLAVQPASNQQQAQPPPLTPVQVKPEISSPPHQQVSIY